MPTRRIQDAPDGEKEHFINGFCIFQRGLQHIPMDAQWMLKGCSMVASANLSTLLKLCKLKKISEQIAHCSNSLKPGAKIQKFFDISKFSLTILGYFLKKIFIFLHIS